MVIGGKKTGDVASTRKCRACGLRVAVIGNVLVDPMRSNVGNVIIVADRVHFLTEEDLITPLGTRPRFHAHLDRSPECRRVEDPKPPTRAQPERVPCPGGMKGKPHSITTVRAIAVQENTTGRRSWVCAKHLPWMCATGWTREREWETTT